MWSDKYYYLNIYKNDLLGEEVSTRELREFICEIPELKKKGEFEFVNRDTFPFVNMLLLKASDLDTWFENDKNSKYTNLISIVCAKSKGVNFEEVKKVFVRIATFLNWKLVDELTDDGIENYIIWQQSQSGDHLVRKCRFFLDATC